MDFDQIAAAVGRQFMTAWNAPIPFFAAVLLAGFVIWKLVQREYATRLTNSASDIGSLERRVKEYEGKLSGATPDEAASRIARLEAQVAALTPRSISPDQERAIAHSLAGTAGTVHLQKDMACPDANGIVAGFERAFRRAGWGVNGAMVLGIGMPSATGIGVWVRDPTTIMPSHQAVMTAFREAEVDFDILPDPRMSDDIVQIQITSRMT